MAKLPSVDAYLEGKRPEGIELFRRFEELVRLRITDAAQLDDALAALVVESYEEVGPGARSLPRA